MCQHTDGEIKGIVLVKNRSLAAFIRNIEAGNTRNLKRQIDRKSVTIIKTNTDADKNNTLRR